MKKKQENKPSWIADFTNLDKKLDVEAFETLDIYSPILIDQGEQKFLCEMFRQYKQGRATYSFPLKLDMDINEELEQKTKGSKNAVINELLRYALADLKKKKKTLTNE